MNWNKLEGITFIFDEFGYRFHFVNMAKFRQRAAFYVSLKIAILHKFTETRLFGQSIDYSGQSTALPGLCTDNQLVTGGSPN